MAGPEGTRPTAPTRLRPPRPETAGAARSALLAWATSRALAWAAILVGTSWPFDAGLRFTGFTTRWDGGFYLGIARDGYGPVGVPFPRWPFFPGLPAVIRALRTLAIDDELGIFVVDHVAFLLALVGVGVLARRHGSGRAGDLAVWSVALFPASFVFSMTYPSALFLAATVWAFVLVEDHHDIPAGVLVAFAAVLRPNGLVVAVALFVGLRSLRRSVVVCGPAVAAVGAWAAYCAHRTGDALVFLTVKGKWEEISIVDLLQGHLVKWSVLPHLVLAGAALSVVWLRRRALPIAWITLAVLMIIPSLFTGIVGMARYANDCFVPFVAAGQVLERLSLRLRRVTLSLGAFGLVVFAVVVARYGLVP